jgi:phosphatidylglycerol---prolipoprotein diacylglyceryl transferase
MLDFPDINPVILSVGPLAVTWYSMSYVVGIMLGWYYAIKLVAINNIGITKKHLDDFVTWVIIGVIIGGRLGYVIFYDPVKYFSNPIEILKTYEGGMSFHGGIIGFICAAFLFARTYSINFLSLTDISAVTVPIALFLGRIANFINGELYGRITDFPFSFIFPYSDGRPRHPSQLYEAFLEGFVLFFIMFYAAWKLQLLGKKGYLSGLFLIFYALFRTIVEFFREPDIQIGFVAGGFTMGQLLCLPMLLVGIYLIKYANRF